MTSTCHCGNPADLLVQVLKTPDAQSSEATYAACFDHLAIAMDAMEIERAKVDGVIKIRNERASAYTHAWFLINHCRWSLNTPEWAILLRLAKAHEEGHAWVAPSMIEHGHRGGSKTNVREMLNRPRVADPKRPLIESRELKGKDGKTRTYYRLAGWDGP